MKITKNDCLKLFEQMKQLLGMKGSTDEQAWEKEGILCLKRQYNTGMIEAGFERFKGGKISMFIHIKVPKQQKDIESVMDMLTIFTQKFPDVEVYYNENYQRDYMHGKEYDVKTHKVTKTFNSRGHAAILDDELKFFSGEKKYSYLNKVKSVDYDIMYAQM